MKEIVKYASAVPSFSCFFIERICRAVICLVNDVIILHVVVDSVHYFPFDFRTLMFPHLRCRELFGK